MREGGRWDGLAEIEVQQRPRLQVFQPQLGWCAVDRAGALPGEPQGAGDRSEQPGHPGHRRRGRAVVAAVPGAEQRLVVDPVVRLVDPAVIAG